MATAQPLSARYDHLLKLAEKAGVRVLGVDSGVAMVYSPKSERTYQVTVRAHSMECDCEAYGYCKHRAAVRAYLLTQRPAATPRQRGPLIDDARGISIFK